MAPLTSEQLLLDHQSSDPSSITSLELSLRALSDVSCLDGFRGLERLDLSCNDIRTLEGLACCGNLKWLSVAQNKIGSLKGVDGLPKLTVRKLVPNLQIFNAKPIEKFSGTRNSRAEDVVAPGRDHRSSLDGDSHAVQKGEKRKKG